MRFVLPNGKDEPAEEYIIKQKGVLDCRMVGKFAYVTENCKIRVCRTNVLDPYLANGLPPFGFPLQGGVPLGNPLDWLKGE